MNPDLTHPSLQIMLYFASPELAAQTNGGLAGTHHGHIACAGKSGLSW